MQDECRILLLHGMLHLLGHDHELGDEEAESMAEQEHDIMQSLGWKVGCFSVLSTSGVGFTHAGREFERFLTV